MIKTAREINTSKSSAIEHISSQIFKTLIPVLSEQFTHLYNSSVSQHKFPNKWKKATVVPIQKAGDRSKVTNLRPISLLPLPGKILERLIHKRLSGHLENEEFFCKNQHGFRKQHSTNHALFQLIDQIQLNNNRGFPTMAVFIDFKKAFDCVQHGNLVSKVKSLETGDKLVAWTENYLTDRKQRVLANNIFSDFATVKNGVPQGSILGPLYYTIYANDIPKIVNSCEVIQYADDTVLLSNNPNIELACTEIQAGLKQLEGWCTRNGIMVNPMKTKAVLFGSKRQTENIVDSTLCINDTEIELVSTYTYLGMLLESTMSLEGHIQKVIQRVTVKLTQLRKMRKFLNKEAALTIYKSMILPIMEYGNIFYDACTLESRKKLQKLQNKALRSALNEDMYSNVNDIHVKAKLNRLSHRRHKQTVLFMHSHAQLLRSKRSDDVSQRIQTRSAGKLMFKLRKPRTERFKKSISYKGRKLWNSLQKEVQMIDDYDVFKFRIKNLYRAKINNNESVNTAENQVADGTEN